MFGDFSLPGFVRERPVRGGYNVHDIEALRWQLVGSVRVSNSETSHVPTFWCYRQSLQASLFELNLFSPTGLRCVCADNRT